MTRPRPRPIVVDANIVAAAMVRDGTTRELILDRGLDLRAPAWLWDEVLEHYEDLRRRSGLAPSAMDELLRLLRSRVTDIPAGAVEVHKSEALALVESTDADDAPYVAAVLAVEGVLWTHDSALAAKGFIPTISTRELLESTQP